VEWIKDDSGQYAVHAEGGGFQADIAGTNFAYVANVTKLILDAPPPGAFEPMPTPEQIREALDEQYGAPELPPHVEAQATADPEDTTEGLNCETRAVVP
jgi:hypothetical protein